MWGITNNLWDAHNHDPPSDKIITGYVPEVQNKQLKFAAENHTQEFYEMTVIITKIRLFMMRGLR